MYRFPFSIGVIREEQDDLGLSSDAIDKLRFEMFTQTLQKALLEAFEAGILPREITVVGEIKIRGASSVRPKSN
jgi:hypothetical protein